MKHIIKYLPILYSFVLMSCNKPDAGSKDNHTVFLYTVQNSALDFVIHKVVSDMDSCKVYQDLKVFSIVFDEKNNICVIYCQPFFWTDNNVNEISGFFNFENNIFLCSGNIPNKLISKTNKYVLLAGMQQKYFPIIDDSFPYWIFEYDGKALSGEIFNACK